ncbi:hypothetical protein [Candidatus Magnetominusculus dajiuhuensis]|uniref:hypothetical protein n=1 Tax=Candidatus Magnetominusculus dajiuhuensis TaxID=3137712 RepID=UPI003B4338C1
MSETMIGNNHDIERINEMLKDLSPETITAVIAFIAYHADRERRHNEFVAETLAAEQEPDSIICDTAEEVMEAIRNWTEEGAEVNS